MISSSSISSSSAAATGSAASWDRSRRSSTARYSGAPDAGGRDPVPETLRWTETLGWVGSSVGSIERPLWPCSRSSMLNGRAWRSPGDPRDRMIDRLERVDPQGAADEITSEYIEMTVAEALADLRSPGAGDFFGRIDVVARMNGGTSAGGTSRTTITTPSWSTGGRRSPRRSIGRPAPTPSASPCAGGSPSTTARSRPTSTSTSTTPMPPTSPAGSPTRCSPRSAPSAPGRCARSWRRSRPSRTSSSVLRSIRCSSSKAVPGPARRQSPCTAPPT